MTVSKDKRIDFNKIKIFIPKRGRRSNQCPITFGITLTKGTYKQNRIKFYINEIVLNSLDVPINSKVLFACNENNKTIWYLIFGGSGYTIHHDKNKAISILINCPFNNLKNRKMQSTSNITYHKEHKTVEFNVDNSFSIEELQYDQ